MAVQGLNLSQVQTALRSGQYPSEWATNLAALTQKGLSVNEFASEVERATDGYVKATLSKSGNVIGYTVKGVAQESVTPVVTNSNAVTIARGTISAPVSTTTTVSNTVNASRLIGIGSKVATTGALIGTAAMCVGAGITLGKTIDSVLYNLNPDFWDSNGMSTLNPETWRTITANDDSLGASLLNVLFGFDDNGNMQAYIDENAFAYFASYMQSKNAFNVTYEASDPTITTMITQPISVGNGNGTIVRTTRSEFIVAISDITSTTQTPTNFYDGYIVFFKSGNSIILGAACNAPIDATRTIVFLSPVTGNLSSLVVLASNFNVNGVTGRYVSGITSVGYNWSSSQNIAINQASSLSLNANTAYVICNAVNASSGIAGIGTQPNATTPTGLSGNPSTDLLLLQQQYPDLWNNAINYPVVQPDGTVQNYTYVPVSLPENFTRTGTQPESGTSTQVNTEINPITSPQDLIDALTKILTNPVPETETELNNDNPPENPTNTGENSSPTPVVPVGSASALWKIYHPTQAQIDSFGGWLWSSNFIDQILKIFNNPMEAVIGLHKVYATPIDAGTSTIKVGYLDSQVPSAYIEQQYIDVSCGSVNLYEQFGNVFDYSPFTDVQLYLPFVGIVPLNVGDIMRSTISVNYGVDVITGACLAQVEVSRDGNSSVLYQYSGNCAVQYPISSGSYMGIVSSIISVAGGVAATVASGGAAAPLALGAAGGLLSAHTSVQHSGGFSGNAGAMGGKIPYLIITRPQTKVAINAETMQGYPTNNYVTVGECSGYIKADSVHVINVNATDEELTEINNLLLNGIII